MLKSIIKDLLQVLTNRYIIFHGSRRKPVVALTFDDGPSPIYTVKILNILSEYNIKATFFLIGRKLKNNLEIFDMLKKAGHELGNHSYDHQHKYSFSMLSKEIKGMQSSLLYRPPYGVITLFLILLALRNKIRIILWSFDTHDSMPVFYDKDRYGTKSFYTQNIKNGDIILLHDDNAHCVEILPHLINDLESRGFSFGTVSKMLFQERKNEHTLSS